MEKIKIISIYTFREIIKSKILINTLFLGLGLLLVTFVALSFTYGEPSRIALDFGLGMLTLSSVGIAIFIGVGLLSNEITNRTVYMIISRPVPRYAFIIGKMLGLSAVLLLNILILSLLTLSLYFFIGGEFSPLILWSIIYIIIESMMVLFLVCVLSLVSSQTLTVIISMSVYIVGHSIKAAKDTSMVKSSEFLQYFLDSYHFVFPGFYKLNLKEFVLYNQNLPLSYLTVGMLYGICYCIFLMLVSILIFDRKNID